MLNLKYITKLITKNSKRKSILFLLGIVLFLLTVVIFYLRIENANARNGTEYIAIEPTAPHAEDSILVRFKKPYNPFYLQKEIDRRAEISGKSGFLLRVENAWNAVTDKNNPEETLHFVNNSLQSLGVNSYRKIDKVDIEELNGSFVLNLPNGTDIPTIQKELEKLGFFESSEPSFVMELFAQPNDQYYQQLWGMAKIEAPVAWDLVTGEKTIIVAVIDSGSEPTHPDLQANIIAGANLVTGGAIQDGNGHGTHVAGTIGAVGNNNIGVTGVNWNVSIMPIQVFNASGKSSSSTVFYEAISYAVANGAKVINMSLGNPSGHVPCTSSSEYARRIDYAVSQGVVVVVAAGNETRDAASVSPASCDNAITVGASTQSDTRANFSNFGPVVDIAAPGVAIASTWRNAGYNSIQGTSMASPHVAGAAALLLSANPSMAPSQVKDCLIQNGDTITTDRPIGGVRLNIAKALLACSNITPPPGFKTPTPTLSPTPKVAGPTVTGGPTPTPIEGRSGSWLLKASPVSAGSVANIIYEYDFPASRNANIATFIKSRFDSLDPNLLGMADVTFDTPLSGKGSYTAKGNVDSNPPLKPNVRLNPPIGLKCNETYVAVVYDVTAGSDPTQSPSDPSILKIDNIKTPPCDVQVSLPPRSSGPTATPASGRLITAGTPTPTPNQYFTCMPDPKCANSKSIQLCPLVCAPRQ